MTPTYPIIPTRSNRSTSYRMWRGFKRRPYFWIVLVGWVIYGAYVAYYISSGAWAA